MINPSVTPLGTNVILTPIKEPQKSSSIHIPDSIVMPVNKGIVYNMSKKVNSIMFGDKVLFDPEVAHKFQYKDQDFIVVRESDIIAKI